MIDFLKIDRLKSNIRKNPLLEGNWILTSNEDSVFLGEEVTLKKLKFETKKFKESDNYYSKVSGSIHYYFNNGLHNYNDFKFSNIVSVLNEITFLFEIDQRNNLNNLEFGVNIKLPFETKLILDNLVTHKSQSFSGESNNKKNYYQCKHSQFIIKIYDKGLQFGLAENILRFEIKVIKMQYLHKNGIKIKTLNCLKIKEVYQPLGKLLLKVYNEILIDCESINLKSLTEAERITYLKATRQVTWKGKNRVLAKEQKQLQRLLEKYYKLIKSQIEGVSIKAQVAQLIEKKWNELSEIYRTEASSPTNPIVHYLPFKYNVTLGQQPIHHHFRPSTYLRDF